MKPPAISVIITTFNRPALLSAAMQSVLCQTCPDFELIVVNDCSGPETSRVLAACADPRLRHLRNGENRGSAKSLNIGLCAARGEYIAILDDDDLWLSPLKLEHQLAHMRGNPACVLLATNIIVTDASTGEELIRSYWHGDDAALRARLLRENMFAHSSVMYRRVEALKAGGYDLSLERGKDFDLWLKLARLGQIAILPGMYVQYREQGFAQRNVFEVKKRDCRAELRILARHGGHYPGFLAAYAATLARYCTVATLAAVRAAFLRLRPGGA